MSNNYPKRLVHPAYEPAVLADAAANAGLGLGKPARYPPVDVANEEQEEAHRAMGYAEPGETAPVAGWNEYPKMLRHPDHSEAVPDELTVFRNAQGAMEQALIRGKPAVRPDIVVHSIEEEERKAAEGYAPIGRSDPRAFEKARSAPSASDPQEWPKWVDGVLVEDPDAPPPATNEYPKWVRKEGAEKIVGNRSEELAFYNEGREAAEIDEIVSLRALAEENGIRVDGRWGANKLRAVIQGAAA